MDQQVLSIREFCEAYGISKTSAYEEIRHGRLLAVKARKRTLIRKADADTWLADLPAARRKDTAPS